MLKIILKNKSSKKPVCNKGRKNPAEPLVPNKILFFFSKTIFPSSVITGNKGYFIIK